MRSKRSTRAAPGEAEGCPPPPPADTAAVEAETVTFPVVGVGASAGGLAAFEAFFGHLPPDPGVSMAFVVVQHLDPGHKSILSELVARYTPMRVEEITDDTLVEPSCTYIIPPDRDLELRDGRLYLLEPARPRGLRLPIDGFYRSLAHDRADHAICVVLSGNGTDGTLGLRAVKEAGGMAMVQDPQTADYDGMPRSAIATGLADYVLPPEEMPAQLIAYVQRALAPPADPLAASAPEVSAWMLKVMALLRTHTGHDFTHYKQSTIRRRVDRRMAVNQVERVEHYVRLLRHNPAELDMLFRELLIGVTGFFRDPEAFDLLRDQVIPQLLPATPADTPLRVWVPGCSTGEEAYSLAILLQEEVDQAGRERTLQLFATDIDHAAIEKARAAVYPASIAADVSPERLARFFVPEGADFYRIRKPLRDQLVFAEQDVLRDPPFSRIDLISCRNLLIYLEPVLQKRLLPLFHYALAPGGFLFLGNSETIGEFHSLFVPVDRKWKLYRRRDDAGAGALQLPALPGVLSTALTAATQAEPPGPRATVRELTERVLLQSYAPATVAVNEQGEILYVHGRTGKYLELAAGEISVSLVRTAREGLRHELATALRRVAARREPVRYEGLEVRGNGDRQRVNVTVQPLLGPAGELSVILVTFEDVATPAEEPAAEAAAPADGSGSTAADRRVAALERELRIKDETLQSTVEELETSNEELKSTNEELQSTNEELQSANEELETSKEELQSVNEELVTVNAELQQKIESLSRANNDMSNLLAGTGIAMLFVDHALRIQRFTPAATQIINLIETDVGRPISHLASNLIGYSSLVAGVQAVLASLVPREARVQTRDGHWYLMRILPYRTMENVIEGVVVTFVNVTDQKQAEDSSRRLGADLERRVQDRAAELVRANAELQRQVGERQRAEEAHEASDAALRHGPLAMWAVDRELRLTATGGELPDGARGTPLAECGDLERVLDQHRQALAGAASDYESDWRGIPRHNYLLPLFDSAGQVLGVVGAAFKSRAEPPCGPGEGRSEG